MRDSAGNTFPHEIAMRACRFADAYIRRGQNVLFHCFVGASRSCVAAATYIAARERCSVLEAYRDIVCKHRTVANANVCFLSQAAAALAEHGWEPWLCLSLRDRLLCTMRKLLPASTIIYPDVELEVKPEEEQAFGCVKEGPVE